MSRSICFPCCVASSPPWRLQLLAVRSGEVQVTAALGSAVAHVSDASRQRLWKLWQAAAHVVSSARGHTPTQQQTTTAAAVGGAAQAAAKGPTAAATVLTNGEAAEAAEAATSSTVGAARAGSGGAVAPLASGLLAQSRAALQVRTAAGCGCCCKPLWVEAVLAKALALGSHILCN
jgi:hypothetical protein